jgi:hypothetical protein
MSAEASAQVDQYSKFPLSLNDQSKFASPSTSHSAAVLAADAAGYSRAMSMDEARALAAAHPRQSHRRAGRTHFLDRRR